MATLRPLLGLVLALGATAAGATLCESGRRQSPIDIGATQPQALPVLAFHYQEAPLTLAHDGHTLRVRLPRGSTLDIGTQHYTLQQFHFHTPGGDRIAGEEFPMAAHLLHKSTAGQLLSVVVLFRLGEAHPLLDALLPQIPAKPGGDLHPVGLRVQPQALLPAQRGYYRYSGSLTAPPCTEGVDWIVLKQPLTLSAAQLARWREHFADNARAVQPLNRRTVLESR